jgi:hypothetical protein
MMGITKGGISLLYMHIYIYSSPVIIRVSNAIGDDGLDK